MRLKSRAEAPTVLANWATWRTPRSCREGTGWSPTLSRPESCLVGNIQGPVVHVLSKHRGHLIEESTPHIWRESADVGVGRQIGNPVINGHGASPFEDLTLWVREPHGCGHSLLCPVSVPTASRVTGTRRLHKTFAVFEPFLPISPGVVPPRGPIAAVTQNADGFGCALYLSNPVPALAKADEVETLRQKGVGGAVSVDSEEARCSPNRTAKHLSTRFDGGHQGPTFEELTACDAGPCAHVGDSLAR